MNFEEALEIVMAKEIEKLQQENQELRNDIQVMDDIEKEIEDARR